MEDSDRRKITRLCEEERLQAIPNGSAGQLASTSTNCVDLIISMILLSNSTNNTLYRKQLWENT
ncbi:hypothetical protein PtA15_17A217 [Puccinia triticina]|uniref:Uncharacterized protein n=1 Tax=Puccinia triticina TaxID=208348 RepID=A0ABY7D9P4_9BASI|nr:uncharacterized protein PtA15_17A217 [Puccinia triticina]WAQ92735.1 hypothetical protein PtA15_17A217 [Puccinia triticina]